MNVGNKNFESAMDNFGLWTFNNKCRTHKSSLTLYQVRTLHPLMQNLYNPNCIWWKQSFFTKLKLRLFCCYRTAMFHNCELTLVPRWFPLKITWLCTLQKPSGKAPLWMLHEATIYYLSLLGLTMKHAICWHAFYK